ncbi:MAG TPA: periplasmic heavy metal sensor [Thermoanaerobaculaceae bacterium]|nr:periplasmic heavy metal sensor [Thermoanaerobaculaceae bacterium]
MRITLALSLVAALAAAAPILAQEPPFPAPGGPGDPAAIEGIQPPPGGPCGFAGREGMPEGRHGGPGAPGTPGMAPHGLPPEAALKDALGLSDDQVAALRSLLATRGIPSEAQLAEVRGAEKALGDALKGPNPDPTRVGTLLLKVEEARKRAAQPGEAFRAEFAKILTPAQQQKLDQLVALEKSLQAAEALQRLGI